MQIDQDWHWQRTLVAGTPKTEIGQKRPVAARVLSSLEDRFIGISNSSADLGVAMVVPKKVAAVPKKVSAVPKKTKAGRRSYRDIFLDKLRNLTGTEQKLISNSNVREALGWDEEQYKRIKGQLLDEGMLVVGRGYGGSVGLVSAPGAKALSLFISYSHVDEQLKNELLKHLAPLKRLKLIDAWHDRKLKAGDTLDHEISVNLEKSDIAVFLISVDFINSQYCYDVELEKALELHAKEQLVVVPVILRNCLWQHTPLAKLIALPRDGKAVMAWADRDEALADVAEGLRLKALDILDNK